MSLFHPEDIALRSLKIHQNEFLMAPIYLPRFLILAPLVAELWGWEGNPLRADLDANCRTGTESMIVSSTC